MHAMKSLTVLALAAVASASFFNGELLRREVLIHARATATTTAPSNNTAAAACSSVLQGLATVLTGLPTPTGALSSYLATAATTLTNPCDLGIPSSIAPAFSVYESSVLSFYYAHMSQLDSALAICPGLTSLVVNPACSTTATAAGVTTSTATSTAVTVTAPTLTTAGPTSTSSIVVVSTAGANPKPRETGLVAAAMVAAGFFGAVAVAL